MSILQRIRQSWKSEPQYSLNDESGMDLNASEGSRSIFQSILENEHLRLDWCLPALVHAIVGCVLANLNFTMHIAFFPKASKERGLSSISTGAIFSIFQICFLATTFLMPKILKRLDAWTVLKYSVGLQAVVTGLFAFTGKLHNCYAFFLLTVTLRGIEGVLAACTEVSSLEVTKKSVPGDLVGEAVAWTESARTLGIVIGPLTGGGMHHAAGYKGPFIFSACCFLVLFFAMLVLPADKKVQTMSSEKFSNDTVWKLGNAPVFMLMTFVILLSCSAISFLEPTLQPMVSEAPYNLNEIEMALVYLCLVIMYGVSALLATSIASVVGNLFTIITGIIFISLGFFTMCPPKTFSGPLSLFAFWHHSSEKGAIGVLTGGLSCIGFGGGLALIPATLMMLKESERVGMLHTEDSMDAINLIVNTVYNVGGILGPFIAGILDDTAGFSKAANSVGMAVIVGGIITVIATSIILKRRPPNEEDVKHETDIIQSPLLDSTHGADLR